MTYNNIPIEFFKLRAGFAGRSFFYSLCRLHTRAPTFGNKSPHNQIRLQNKICYSDWPSYAVNQSEYKPRRVSVQSADLTQAAQIQATAVIHRPAQH